MRFRPLDCLTSISPCACSRMVVLTLLAGSLAAAAASGTGDLKVIPLPAAVETSEGTFVLTRQTTITVSDNSPELQRLAMFLRDALRAQSGLDLAIAHGTVPTANAGSIELALNAKPAEHGKEAYELLVSKEGVSIRADEAAGVFYGAQTLLQLASPQLSSEPGAQAKHAIRWPCLRIVDRPRFAWRGLMLDCSRTFLPLAQLKKYVDVCSFYKLNVLQLHLTDDQGWRLEIRKHPRLTEVGSNFDARFPGEVSGFYTQQQIRELVQYAADRQVTIVPEIEMPGHCLALLKSYPELSCQGGADQYVIAPYMFLSDSSPGKDPRTPYGVLCPGNEKTFAVLEDVIAEVTDLFPSEYIHIAGDECTKSYWKACPKCQARIKAEGLKDEDELQSYFIKRIARMIQGRGRKVLGWDETLEGGLPPGMAVMSWRGFEAGITVAKQGHPVVMASKSHVYLDYCYNRTPASLIYEFEPVPRKLDTPKLRPLVMGGEACMWTHLARTEAGIDMSLFPRLLALAETLWTPADRRDWTSFSDRLKRHEAVLKSKSVACFARNEGPGLPNLTCGQDGRLWLVNAAGEVYLRTEAKWERFPGKARQVTSTRDGAVWSVSMQQTNRGYALMRWAERERQWQPLGKDIAAVQIAAAPDGSIWAATEAYALWRYAEGKWENELALAREVSVGPDGTVWVLTIDPAPGGFELYAIPPKGRLRRVQPLGSGTHVAAGGAGKACLILADGGVKYLSNGKYTDRRGKLASLTAFSSDAAWGLTPPSPGGEAKVVRWTEQDWEVIGPVP